LHAAEFACGVSGALPAPGGKGGATARPTLYDSVDTERLTLREPAPSDLELVRDYYRRNAARFAPFEPVPADTAEDFRAWLVLREAERRAGGAAFLAFERGTQRLAAVVILNAYSADDVPSGMLSYTVDGAFEGRGYASEAARRVAAYARDELGLRALIAYYHPDNARSERLLRRLGFREVARTAVIPGFEALMRPSVMAVLEDLSGA
jgi:ribosomal-protein-alanine N-acetyltransferase